MATVTQQIDNVVARFKQDPNNEVLSRVSVLGFLNEAQDIVESYVILPAAKASTTINLVAGTQEYPLADDMIKPVLFRYTANDWVMKEISFNDAKKRFDSSTGTPQEYYIWGLSVGFYPVPSGNESGGVKYWYIKTLSTLVEDNAGDGEVETSTVPVQFHWVLERGAEMLMSQAVNDQERAAIAERKFMEGIQLMKSTYMMNTYDIDSELYPEDGLNAKTVFLFDPYQ